MTGDPLVGRGAVAQQARLGLASRYGLPLGHLVERIERRPDDFVGRRELDHAAAKAEADHDVVVEVDRARGLGRDPVALKARLREDEHLRRLGHVEFPQQRTQVAMIRLEIEFGRPLGDAILEPRDRISGRRRAVIDRVALDVLPETEAAVRVTIPIRRERMALPAGEATARRGRG